MSPWDIVGWLLVAFLALVVGIPVLGVVLASVGTAAAAGVATASALLRYLVRTYRHLRTRNTPPAAGQTWRRYNSGREIVVRVWAADRDKDRVDVSWGVESFAGWRQHVRRGRMYLVESKS